MSDRYQPGYSVVVWFPIPIVPKARPRVTRGGAHTYMPTKYETSLEAIALLLLNPFRGQNPEWPTDRSYEVFVEVDVDRVNAGDVDNILGTVMDAARGIVWRDDCQVVSAKVTKHIYTNLLAPSKARLEFRLREPTGFEPKPKRGRGAVKRPAFPASRFPSGGGDARKGPPRGSKA